MKTNDYRLCSCENELLSIVASIIQVPKSKDMEGSTLQSGTHSLLSVGFYSTTVPLFLQNKCTVASI